MAIGYVGAINMRLAFCLLIICACFVDVTKSDVLSKCGWNGDRCYPGIKFYYREGVTYTYSYSANIVSSVAGASQDFSGLYVEADVELHAITFCHFAIRLKRVNLRSRTADDPAPSNFAMGHEQFQNSLEAHSFYATFEDGAIDSVCTHPDDKPWVVNIKRAIVSMLQSRAEDNLVGGQLVERDVLGDCPTEYTVDYYKWTSLVVTKTKNLNGCSNRGKFVSTLQSSPYVDPAQNDDTLLQSKFSCSQAIDDKLINRVSCEESYQSTLFANGDSAVTIQTRQTLVLVGENTPSNFKDSDTTAVKMFRTTLLFDHQYQIDTESDSREAEQILTHLCSDKKLTEERKTPKLFYKLVNIFGKFNLGQMSDVVNNIDRFCLPSSHGMDIVIDLLPMVGTEASLALMTELMMANKVSEDDRNVWLRWMALTRNPTDAMLSAVLPLVIGPSPSSQVLLTVSALANSVCSKITNCSTEIASVKSLLGTLENLLTRQCQIHDQTPINDVIVTLKSVGNLGQHTTKLLNALEKCSTIRSNVAGLRVAAIEAYRKLPCSISRIHLVKIFEKRDEETEVRMAAYMQLVRCIDRPLMDKILKLVRDESVSKQVKSFVWSYLKSVRETADPCKKSVSLLLEEVVDFEELDNVMEEDIRKFSRFFDKSLYSEQLQLGGHLEANVIYSTNSFLPRSVGLNFTADIFGHSVNLLQVTARGQGLDLLAESLFRPEPSSPKRNKNTNRDRIDGAGESKVISLPMEGSLSAKIFGQEIWMIEGNEKMITELVNRMSSFTWTDLVRYLAEDNAASFQQNIILMDTVHVRPTATGFPLILNVNATANVHIKAGGRMGLVLGHYEVEGRLKHASTIIAESAMTLDGYLGKLGTRLIADIHTSVILDGKIEYKEGEKMKLSIDVPEDKMDLVVLSSKVVINQWERDTDLRVNASINHHWRGCTGMALAVGVQLCGQISYPNASLVPSAPYLPLNGPILVSVTLDKTDVTLKSYLFQYLQRETLGDDGPSTSFLLSFSTPHSVIDREWTVHYSFVSSDGSLNLRVVTPMKKVEVRGHFKDEERHKELIILIDVDNQQAYCLEVDVRLDYKEVGSIHLTPKILLQSTSHTNLLTIEGYVSYVPGRKLTIELATDHITQKPIMMKVSSSRSGDSEQEEFGYEITFNSPMMDANLVGTLKSAEGGGLTWRTTANYQLEGSGRWEIIELTGKTRLSQRPLTTATALLDIHTSALAVRDVVVHWELQMADEHLEQTLTVKNRQKQNLFWAQHVLSYGGTLEKNRLNARAEAIWSKTHFLFNVSHFNTPVSFLSHVYLQPNTAGRYYALEASVDDQSEVMVKLNSYVKIKMDLKELFMSLNITEEDESHYVILWRSEGEPIPSVNATLIYDNNNSLVAVDQSFILNATSHYWWSKLDVHGQIYVSEDNGQLMVDTQGYHKLKAVYERVGYKEYEGVLTVDTVARGSLINGRGKLRNDNNLILEQMVGTLTVEAIWLGNDPSRKRKITFEGNWRDGYDLQETNFEVLWDAERDLTRHMNISTFLRSQRDASKSSLKINYLRKEIVMELIHDFQGVWSKSFNVVTHCLLQWDGVKRLGVDASANRRRERAHILNGALELYTPLISLEEVHIQGSHQDNGSSWRTNGSVVINNNWEYTVVSFGKDWKSGNQRHLITMTNLTTPYEGLETVGISLEHFVASRELKTITLLAWGQQISENQMELTLNAIRPDANYKQAMASFQLKTPFKGLETAKFSLNHQLTASTIDTWTQLEWNMNPVIHCGLHGLAAISKQGLYNLNGNATIAIPIDGFRNVSCSLKHSHSSNLLSSELSGRWGVSEQASIAVSGFKRQTELSADLQVVIPSNKFGVSAQYQRPTPTKIVGNLNGHWGDASSELTLEGNYVSIIHFDYRAELNTPIERLDRVIVSVMNVFEGTSINSNIKCQLGVTKAEVSVEGSWKSGGLSVGHFRCETPWQKFPRVLISVHHGRSHPTDDTLSTGLGGEWDDLTFNLNHTIQFQNWSRLEDRIYLSLPFDGLENCSSLVQHAIVNKTISELFQLEAADLRLLSLAFEGRFDVTSKRKRNLNALFRLDTSIWTPHGVELRFDHEDDGVEYRPALVLRTMDPAKRILEVVVVLRTITDQKALNVTIADVGHLNAGFLIKGKEVDFGFDTNWRDLRLTGHFDIDFLAPRLLLTIYSENNNFFKIDSRYNVWATNKIAYFFLQKGEWRIGVNGSGSFEPDKMSGGIIIDISPSTGFEILYLNVSAVAGSALNKNFKVSLKWMNSKVLAMTIGIQKRREGRTMMVSTITTPVDWLKMADFSLIINEGKSVESIIRWNREHIVELWLTYNEALLDTTLLLRSTHSTLPQVKLTVLCKTESRHKRLLTALEVDKVKWRAEVNLKLQNRKTDLIVELDTPDSYSLNGTWLTGSRNGIQAVVKTPEQVLNLVGNIKATADTSSATGQLNVNENDSGRVTFTKNKKGPLAEISFEVEKPVSHLKVKRLYLSQRESTGELELEASVTTDSNDVHRIVSKCVRSPSPKIELVINSPALGQRNPLTFSSGLKLNKKPLEIDSETSLQLGNSTNHKLQLQVFANGLTSMSTVLVVNSPLLLNGEVVRGRVGVMDTVKGLNASVNVQLPSGDYALDMIYERDLKEGATYLFVNGRSPLPEAGMIRIMGKHKGHEWDNTEVSFEMTTPIKGYETFKSSIATAHVFGSQFQLDVRLATPYAGYEDIVFSQHFNYSMELLDVGLMTRYRFDNFGLDFDGQCDRKSGVFYIDGDARWWPLDSVNEKSMVKYKVATQPWLIEVLSEGNRWNLNGRGHYNGWRDVHCQLNTISDDKMHFELANDFKVSRPNAFLSYVVLHWVNRTLVDLKLGGEGRGNVYFNFTTPFAVFQKIYGSATVGRDEQGLQTDAQLIINGHPILNGTFLWLSNEDPQWRNRTAVLELDNAWQPIGIRALMMRRSAIWEADARVIWNFADRQLSSAGVVVQVNTTVDGRDVEITLIHPKHKCQLRAGFEKGAQEFTHKAGLTWAEKPFIAYHLWTSSSATQELAWRKDAKFTWEHPGRSILIDGIVFKRKTNGFVLLQSQLKLDRQKQGLELNAEYSGSRMAIILKHPQLERNVELTGELFAQEHGTKILDAKLCYSPDTREDLKLKVAIFKHGLEGHAMVVHHATHLDIATFWYTDKANKANLSLHYDDHRLIIDGYKGHDKQLGSINVLAGTVQRLVNVLSVVATKNSPQNVTVLLTSPSVTIDVKTLLENPYIEIHYDGTGNNTIDLEAGLDPTLRKFVYQTNNLGPGLDASVIFHLNTTRMLTARGYWTPDIVSRVRETLLERISSVHHKVMAWSGLVWNNSATEFMMKWNNLVSGMFVAFQPLTGEIKQGVNYLLEDFSSVRHKLLDMYSENDFFIQDIWPLLESVYNSFSDYFKSIWESLNSTDLKDFTSNIGQYLMSFVQRIWNRSLNLMTNLLSEIWRSVFDLSYEIATLFSIVYDKISNVLSAIPAMVTNWMNNFSASSSKLMESLSSLVTLGERLKEVWNAIVDTLLRIRDWLKNLLNEVKIWLTSNTIYKFLRYELLKYFYQTIVSVYNWASELFNNWLQLLRKYMAEEPKRLLDEFLSTIIELRNRLWTFIVYDIQNIVVDYFGKTFWSVYSKWVWFIHYFKLWPHGYLTIFEWYSYWTGLFGTTAEVFTDRFYSPNYFLVSPEKGKVELDQVLPFPWRDFQARPAFNQIKEFRTLSRLWSFFHSDSDDGVPFMTRYYQFMEYSRWSWLPPFTGQALVAGRQNFISFDGKVTEFSGNCNYILTKDLLDGNFSVIINYEEQVKSVSPSLPWSLTVEVDGSTVLLLPDFRIFVDGKKVELPKSFGHTSIKREDKKVILTYEYGLEVICLWQFELCTVRVSGWYFGRLGGMLGTYNYESWDDRKTIEGVETENYLNWGKSWSVGTCHSKKSNVPPTTDHPGVEAVCDDLFNGTVSIFRHCYSKIPPDDYKRMCLNDVLQSHSEDAVCSSAAAYVEKCQSQGVPIRMDKRCVRCVNIDGSSIEEGGNVTVNGSANKSNKSTDVVFIVEAKKCNRGLVAMFGDLVMAVDVALQQVGVVQKRFAVVAFGGSGTLDSPHIYTLDSEIFSRQWHAASISSLQLGRGSKDVFDALKYASKLSFLPGTSKTFVAATCSSGELIEMRSDYPEVHRMLLEDGITLHLLLDRDFRVKKPLQFYGLDGVAAFTSKDGRGSAMRGDPDLRRQVAPPKDIYVPIALESNGSVFSSLYLSPDLSKKDRKTFVDVFSRRVAQSSEVDICHTCDCLPDEDGVGRLYCQPCIFPKPKHVYADPNGLIHGDYISIYDSYNPNSPEEAEFEAEEIMKGILEVERKPNRPKI